MDVQEVWTYGTLIKCNYIRHNITCALCRMDVQDGCSRSVGLWNTYKMSYIRYNIACAGYMFKMDVQVWTLII